MTIRIGLALGAALLFAAAAAPAAAGPGETGFTALVEVVEAPSVTEVGSGRIVSAETRSVRPGVPLLHAYTEPSTGHRCEVELTLSASGGAESPAAVRLSVRWVDRTADEVRLERRSLAVDGAFLLSLYRLPGGEGEAILRLTPRPSAP